jgi:hypothetical protein
MFKSIGDWLNRYGGWMGLIGLIFTVIGVLVSYLLREYAQVSYTFSTVKVVSQAGPSIKVMSATGEPIDGDVYVTDLTIWNSGNDTIEKNQVREAITISVDNELVQIEKSKENTEAADFELYKVPSAPNARYLDWQYFDPNYGVRIALVTAGEHLPKVEVEGEIFRVDIVPVMDPSVVKDIRIVFATASSLIVILLVVAVSMYVHAYESRVKLTIENVENYGRHWAKTLRRARYLFIGIIIIYFLLVIGYTLIEVNWTTLVPRMLADI